MGFLKQSCIEANRGDTRRLEKILNRMRFKMGMKHWDIADLFVRLGAVEDVPEFEELMQELELTEWEKPNVLP